MIIYAVDLDVAPTCADEYLAWLRDHVREILALPGFVGAAIFARIEPAADDGWLGCTVHYRMTDRAAFDAYLHDHAPRLRADGARRFGGRFRARRAVLEGPQ